MKKIEDITNQEWEITTGDIEKINFIIEELKFIKKDKKISEASFRKMKNITREVQILEDLFINKIINLLKQHHMVD
jgi:hypothetical protein